MTDLIIKLQQHNLIDELGNIILERYDNGYQAVDQETFALFFGDILNNNSDKYKALTQNNDKGYKRFFDKWKELGIL